MGIETLGLGLGLRALKYQLGQDAAGMERDAGMERLRREKMAQEQTLGEGAAAAGASGLVYSTGATGASGQSSMSMYLSGMAQEFRRRNDFNQRMIERGYDLSSLGNTLGLVNDVGRSVFSYAQMNATGSEPPTRPPTRYLWGG